MARVRVLKRQGNSYIELPKEMNDQDELELFQLKEGYYLISLPLGQKQAAAKPNNPEPVTDREKEVLKKLLSIRFENRVPDYVSKALSDQEKTILRELERRKLVNVFKGDKYREGVYNISDSTYSLLSGREPETRDTKPGTATDLPAILKRQGYLVVMDRNEARALSERLNPEMKSGSIAGVKGFDNKFYIATRQYIMAAQGSIAAALKEPMDAAGIAAAAKLDPEGCIAVLHIMAEAGDVIEKKRGIFAPA